MGNIVTYLQELGSDTLAERPFNDVDNLVLATLSYLDLTGIVPTIEQHGQVSMKRAMNSAILLVKRSNGVGDMKPAFIRALGESKRFGTAQLKNFSVILDAESGTQFSALEISLSDGTSYVSFRGTDNSFVGWKEDFTMSYQVMPSQREAARYLNRVIRLTRRYRVGGHSKGGTLAEYAALKCNPLRRARIMEVYNNDGPGLPSDVVDLSDYGKVKERLTRIVPTFDVFGQVFQHGLPNKIVRSSEEGIMQHDSFSWQVEHDHFVCTSQLSPDCAFINKTLHDWIESLDLPGRKKFVDGFFETLEEKGIREQTEFSEGGPLLLQTLALQIVTEQNPSAEGVVKLAAAGIGALDSLDLRSFLHEQHLTRGAILFGLGLFFMVNPDFMASSFIYVMGVVAQFWVGSRIVRVAETEGLDTFNRRLRLIGYIIVLCVVSFSMAQQALVTRFSNLVLGALFLVGAFHMAQKATAREKPFWHRVGDGVIAAGSFALGMFPMLTARTVVEEYIYVASIIVTLYGAASIVWGMWAATHPEANLLRQLSTTEKSPEEQGDAERGGGDGEPKESDGAPASSPRDRDVDGAMPK